VSLEQFETGFGQLSPSFIQRYRHIISKASTDLTKKSEKKLVGEAMDRT
jgi:hypothetical protein